MTSKTITILGEEIPVSNDRIDIYKLKFLRNNPRVYACTHGQSGFEGKAEDEQQQEIFHALLKEPSVAKVKGDLEHHGGLMEPILVRMDTMEVIEGNSRLAAYRKLDEKHQDGQWTEIECSMVSSLTEKQQAAYLNQIHVKGKTKWSAYEKANFAFVHKRNGHSFEEMAKMFRESQSTLRTRVRVIGMMTKYQEDERSNFSYYDVIVRNPQISSAMKEKEGFCNWLLENIRKPEKEKQFTAQDMRKQLPAVLSKPKVLNRLMAGKLTLEDAYSLATVSKAQKAVRHATALLQDISAAEMNRLGANSFNALKQDVRKLGRAYRRIAKIIEKADGG